MWICIYGYESCRVGMMFYDDGGSLCFVEALELWVVDLEGVAWCLKIIFFIKRGC